MSITFAQASTLVEHHTRVLDCTGEPLGLLAQVYVDEDTNEPLWAAVVFAPPSQVETVVPIDGARIEGDDLVTEYTRQVVMDAPRVLAGDELPWLEAERLAEHYGPHAPSPTTAILPITDAD